MTAPASPATVGHSSGPWHVDGHNMKAVIRLAGDPGPRALLRDPRQGEVIARCEGPHWRANARLIAAAPDLLAQRDAAVAALRDLRARYHRALVSTGTDPEYADAACEAADAAIALAEGGERG